MSHFQNCTLYVLCVLFVVNVSCDAATGCQPNCG